MKKHLTLATVAALAVVIAAPAHASGPAQVSTKSMKVGSTTFTVSQFNGMNYNVSSTPKAKKLTRATVGKVALSFGTITESINAAGSPKTYRVVIDTVPYTVYVQNSAVYKVLKDGVMTPLK